MRTPALITVCAATVAASMLTACSSSSSSAGAGKTSSSGAPTTSASSTTSGPAGSSGTTSPSSGSGSSGASVAAYETEPTSIGDAPKITKAIPRGKKFVLISNGAPYDQSIAAAVKAATSQLGWSLTVLQAKLTDPSTTLSAMTTAINSNADFVQVSATPIAIYQSAIPAARAHHTLIISNAGAEDPNSTVPGVFFLQNGIRDFTEAGKVLAGAALADAAGKTVDVVTTTVPQLGASQPAFTAAVQGELTAQCPACKLGTLQVPEADIQANKGPQDIVAYLQSHPKTRYVIIAVGGSSSGVAQAIKAAGLPSVKLLGSSPTPDALQDMAQGGADLAWMLNSFQVYAWESVDVAARTSVGDTPYNWGAGYWLVNKGNVGQVNNPADPTFPKDFQTQFATLWGVHS